MNLVDISMNRRVRRRFFRFAPKVRRIVCICPEVDPFVWKSFWLLLSSRSILDLRLFRCIRWYIFAVFALSVAPQ